MGEFDALPERRLKQTLPRFHLNQPPVDLGWSGGTSDGPGRHGRLRRTSQRSMLARGRETG